MRALADAAGVNLNAATYHFGTKERLYTETFMRRFRSVTKARLELLRQAKEGSGGKPLSVEVIMDCMMRPALLMVREYPTFPALMARNLFLPPTFMLRVIEEEVTPGLLPFIKELSKTLAHIPADVLRTRITCAGGALLMMGSTWSIAAQNNKRRSLPGSLHS